MEYGLLFAILLFRLFAAPLWLLPIALPAAGIGTVRRLWVRR